MVKCGCGKHESCKCPDVVGNIVQLTTSEGVPGQKYVSGTIKFEVPMKSQLTNFQKIKQFHKYLGDPKNPDASSPNVKNHAVRSLRAKLVFEECKELLAELGFRIGIHDGFESVTHNFKIELEYDPPENFDVTKIAKEASDLLVVTYGTGATFGIDMDVAYNAVHESNMSKMGPNGEIERREDGKILKGKWYKKPDMSVIFNGVNMNV